MDALHRHNIQNAMGQPRRPLTQVELIDTYDEVPKERNHRWKTIGRSMTPSAAGCRRSIFRLFPVVSWLASYRVKDYLVADIVTGFTVAMFQVPQSLGYTLLAAVPPVFALYNSMFPMMMYILFGTVKQASVGADAIISMMTGGVVRQIVGDMSHTSHPVHDVFDPANGNVFSVQEVTSALCVTVGIIQLVFGLLNLGCLNVFLSEQMVNGFSTGVAVQVALSQVGAIFGLPIPHFSGMFTVYKTLESFFTQISDIHLPTLIVSSIAIVLILFVKIVPDPILVRKCGLPVPIELVTVIVFTAASYLMQFDKIYNIAVVGEVPEKLPVPRAPTFSPSLLTRIWVDAFAIAVVSFAITLSLGRIFGQRHNYEVDANQEFLALGIGHIWSSFFSCFPIAASVPRSAVQENAGGKTQIVSVVNIIIILFMILFLGHYLEQLPICILAAIIITSLKKIVMQVQDFKRYWDLSKIDGQVWMVSFLATVFLDVVSGLIVGVAFSLLTLVYKLQRPKAFLMAHVPNTEFFVPARKYQKLRETPGVKVYHFGGAMHFANAEFFKEKLEESLGFTTKQVRRAMKKAIKKRGSQDSLQAVKESVQAYDRTVAALELGSAVVSRGPSMQSQLPSDIILDFSRISWMDGCSVSAIKNLTSDYAAIGVRISIASCSPVLFRFLRKSGCEEAIGSANFYPSVYDAWKTVRNRSFSQTDASTPVIPIVASL
ncbi:solute carrier family 26 member 6-like isoform X2 [Varroa jacobsoni]|uniref:STAS domain-containing protein n=1 Tax=Varroa destructor TaxID=109461 RepID=A0A7M7MCK7_VARDE|nr:solute carrier family 26 member 6-like isoform X2 [Varroa destructor]XP_022699514.1 solute carrier family 26 member 6-like isoform X2 [Varroa jacobsoni]